MQRIQKANNIRVENCPRNLTNRFCVTFVHHFAVSCDNLLTSYSLNFETTVGTAVYVQADININNFPCSMRSPFYLVTRLVVGSCLNLLQVIFYRYCEQRVKNTGERI